MPNVLAVPARNEEGHSGACLEARDGKTGASFDHIVLFANNCTNNTVDVAMAADLRSGIRLHVACKTLPPQQADAGIARRHAMAAALPLAGEAGVLFAKDPDGQVDPDKLARTSSARRQVVTGARSLRRSLESGRWHPGSLERESSFANSCRKI